MKVRHKVLGDFLFAIVAQAMSRGLTYKEGIAVFESAAEVMKQVDKTPEASDESLADLVGRLIEEKLR